MPSFDSLFTVRSGLFAQRRALELVGQNVANAGTAGYTRQEASFVAADPSHVINSPGRGVGEVGVLRYREDFLDRHFRSRNGALGYHSTRNSQLAQVEQIIGDLSEGGLRTALDDFHNAWQNLSLHPGDSAARVQIVHSAEQFVNLAHTSFEELAQLRASMDEAIRSKVGEINSAAQQLAELNTAILSGSVNEQQASALYDRRDMLLDSLSKLGGIVAVQHTNGTVTVHLGSLPLVEKEFAFPIDITIQQEPNIGTPPVVSIQQFLANLTWNGTTNLVKFPAGEVGALMEMRDEVVPSYMQYLDNLVRTLASEVNTRHSSGVPAGSEVDIFTIGPDWMAVEVNAALQVDPNQILAASTLPAQPGDGERARSIAALRDISLLTGAPVGARTVTPGEYLRTISSVLGLQVQEAGRRNDVASLQVEQAEKQRQSVAGVSVDDEMTKMIQYQQAYNAAARVMTTIDEMLDVIINRVGLAGR